MTNRVIVIGCNDGCMITTEQLKLLMQSEIDARDIAIVEPQPPTFNLDAMLMMPDKAFRELPGLRRGKKGKFKKDWQ